MNENLVNSGIDLGENILSDVSVLILNIDNPAFNLSYKSYKYRLLGKTMTEWVKESVNGATVTVVEFRQNEDLVAFVKPYLKNTKYTAILYSDTPLLTHKTFLDIIEYVKVKSLNLCKLTRGFIVENEYFMSIDKILTNDICYFEEEDFITAYSLKQCALISDIMKNRVLSYHMNRGVVITDVNGTNIDADVVIGKNCLLNGAVSLLGDTMLEDNVEITESKIENSIIMQDTKVTKSVVCDSIIGKKCNIEGFAHISKQSILSDGVIVKPFVKISGSKIQSFERIKSFTDIGA